MLRIMRVLNMNSVLHLHVVIKHSESSCFLSAANDFRVYHKAHYVPNTALCTVHTWQNDYYPEFFAAWIEQDLYKHCTSTSMCSLPTLNLNIIASRCGSNRALVGNVHTGIYAARFELQRYYYYWCSIRASVMPNVHRTLRSKILHLMV